MPAPGLNAVDLPLERHQLEGWLTSSAARVFETMMAMGLESFLVPESMYGKPVDRVAAGLAQAELRRVRLAELFFATAEMTELAIQAGRSMPDFSLAPQDLPADYGLIVFGQPISVAQRILPTGDETAELPVVAASWGRFRDSGQHGTVRGVWVSYYVDWAAERARLLLGSKRPRDMAEMLGLWGSGRLAYEREQAIPFGTKAMWPTEHMQSSVLFGLPAAEVRVAEELLRTLVAAWLLMGQTITVEERIGAAASRSRRKQMRRLGAEARPVRLITLRHARPRHPRPSSEAGAEPPGRVYRHTWVVHGHWRNQYYRSFERHRPIWIDDHMAGPEGAPLLGGERVNVLKR